MLPARVRVLAPEPLTPFTDSSRVTVTCGPIGVCAVSCLDVLPLQCDGRKGNRVITRVSVPSHHREAPLSYVKTTCVALTSEAPPGSCLPPAGIGCRESPLSVIGPGQLAGTGTGTGISTAVREEVLPGTGRLHTQTVDENQERQPGPFLHTKTRHHKVRPKRSNSSWGTGSLP